MRQLLFPYISNLTCKTQRRFNHIKHFTSGLLLFVFSQTYAQTPAPNIAKSSEQQGINTATSALWTSQQNAKQGLASSLFSANIDFALQLSAQHAIQLGIEYSQTPNEQGQALFEIFESSADVLTTQDANGVGRAQLSTLFWQDSGTFLSANAESDSELIIGLLDIEGGVDTNDIANDENTQFLLPALVNNSSIYTPDYTMGIRYLKQPSEKQLGYTLLVSRSKGLADKNGHYADALFQGSSQLFIAGEVKWRANNSVVHLGAWKNQAEAAHGFYSALQYRKALQEGELGVLVRVGLTKQEQTAEVGQTEGRGIQAPQTATHSTFSLASTWTHKHWQLGLGVATQRQQAAQDLETHQGEVWLKYTLSEHVAVSIFNQWQWPEQYSEMLQARHSGFRLFLQF